MREGAGSLPKAWGPKEIRQVSGQSQEKGNGDVSTVATRKLGALRQEALKEYRKDVTG